MIYKVSVDFSKEFLEINENQINIGIKSKDKQIKKSLKNLQNILEYHHHRFKLKQDINHKKKLLRFYNEKSSFCLNRVLKL